VAKRGHRPNPDGRRSARAMVRVPQTQFDQLCVAAKRQSVSMAEYIHQQLRREQQKIPKI